MLIELDEYDVRTILKSASILNDNKKIKIENIPNLIVVQEHIYIKVEELLSWIENLNDELIKTQKMLIDMTNDVESNYKHISHWEQSGMSYRDFI